MPRKCSIVGCRGNYDKRKSADFDDNNACSVFGFPKDADRLRKWLHIIPQENMTRNKISDYMGVCQRHFDPRYIVRHYIFHRSDGSVFSTPRDVPVLSNDAIPTIFPIVPSCSPTVSPPMVPPLKRQNTDDRCTEASVKSDELFQKRVADMSVPSYRLLKSNVQSRSLKLGLRQDTTLSLPIRQTASIFKQPVTIISNHPDSKTRADLRHGNQEQPRQLFWAKRLENLFACDENGDKLSTLKLPNSIQGVAPDLIHPENLLHSIAAALHLGNQPITGQTASRSQLQRNIGVNVSVEQPLMQVVMISDHDIQKQEMRVMEARRRLQQALVCAENGDDCD